MPAQPRAPKGKPSGHLLAALALALRALPPESKLFQLSEFQLLKTGLRPAHGRTWQPCTRLSPFPALLCAFLWQSYFSFQFFSVSAFAKAGLTPARARAKGQALWTPAPSARAGLNAPRPFLRKWNWSQLSPLAPGPKSQHGFPKLKIYFTLNTRKY